MENYLLPVGLDNPSNYCYGNSLIQQLYHLPKFRNDIQNIVPVFNHLSSHHPIITGTDPSPSSSFNKKFDQFEKKLQIENTLLQLGTLFQQMNSTSSSSLLKGEDDDQEGNANPVLSIHSFYQLLIQTLDLPLTISQEMRDVSEFFSEIIKILLLYTGKSFEISSPIYQPPPQLDERIPTIASTGPLLFQDQFGGELLHLIQPSFTKISEEKLTPSIKELKIERKEKFYYLSLSLHLTSSSFSKKSSSKATKSRRNVVTIDQSLDQFFDSKSFSYKWRLPTISNDNQSTLLLSPPRPPPPPTSVPVSSSVTTEMCPLPSNQITRIHQLSNYLIIYLRRFQFNFQTQTKEKYFIPFIFHEELDMRKYFFPSDYKTDEERTAPNPRYRLNGLILHLGDDTDGGHYISLIRQHRESSNANESSGKTNNEWLLGTRWFQFNDAIVDSVIVLNEDDIYDEEVQLKHSNNHETTEESSTISLEEIEENVVMLFYTKET